MRAITPLLLLGLVACASSSQDATTTSSPRTVRIVDGSGNVTQLTTWSDLAASAAVMEVSADQAWSVLPQVFRELGIPVHTADSQQRLLGANLKTRGRLGNARLSTYLDCGRTQGGPSADTYDVHLLVETKILPGELDTSQVLTLVDATARPTGFASSPVRCSTTGTLERHIIEGVRTRAWGDDGQTGS